jgi:hypothetical protein
VALEEQGDGETDQGEDGERHGPGSRDQHGIERLDGVERVLEDRVAPDFARTVDIHREPGYDPLEPFVDPGHGPLVISSKRDLLPAGPVEATRFKQLMLDHLFS